MFTLVSNLIAKAGLAGVFMLMLAENIVPVIPSELILPMAGFDAARGQISGVLAAVAGGVASALGGVVWYLIGRSVGLDRLKRFAARMGRWAAVTPRQLDRAEAWFDRWGEWAVAIGRCVPGVRGYICIPAGVASMPFGRFLLWSSLGAMVWSAALVDAGFVLNRHFRRVERWMDPVTAAVFALCAVIYLLRVATWRTRS
jgi:membrane protein DedA with SNARE-associated domain